MTDDIETLDVGAKTEEPKSGAVPYSEYVSRNPNAALQDTLRFEVGKTYLTQGGKRVTIVADNSQQQPEAQRFPSWPKGYESVQGDDVSEITGQGIWRYNRPWDLGRVCGTPHDFSDENNLLLPALED